MREDYYAGLEDRYFLTFEQAKKQKLAIDFANAPPAPPPNKLGITVVDTVKLEDVVPYIDWVSSRSILASFLFYKQRLTLYRICILRTHSSKHGNSVAVIPIADIPKSLTTRPLGLKLENCSMMLRL